MKLGKKIIRALKEVNRDMRLGLPVKQSIVRRMTVKGKTVYARETFTAPIK